LATDSALGELSKMAEGTRGGTSAYSDVNDVDPIWEFQSNSLVLQRFSPMERVTGIEPALSAWDQLDVGNPPRRTACLSVERPPA